MKEQIDIIVNSSELKNITIDMVEKVLDNQISEELLKEVPIIKTLVGIRNVYTTYTDRIFIKKAMNVLMELSDINWKDRVELNRDLDDEDSSGTEKILMAIDRLETIKKCKVFGRLCKLKALGKIDIDNFKRITKLIQDAYLDDLRLLPDFSKKLEENKKNNVSYISMEEYYPLMNLGLIFQEQLEQEPIELVEPSSYNDPEPYYRGGEMEITSYISDLGDRFIYFYSDLFPND
jgi:hypothetical protein